MMREYKRFALIGALCADVAFNIWALAEMYRRDKAWKRVIEEDTASAAKAEADASSAGE